MNNDYIISIAYSVVWFSTLFFYQKKKKTFDAGSFLLILYCLYSLCSLRLLSSSFYSWKELKLFPYIYLYICSMIGLLPLIKLNINSNTLLRNPSIKLTNIFSIIFIISTLFSMTSTIHDLVDGIRMIMIDTATGRELYEETTEYSRTAGGAIDNFSSVISGAFTGIGIFLTFYYMTLEKSNKLILYCLFLSCIMVIVTGIASGQRGPVVQPILVMIATYFMLKNKILAVYNKIIKTIGIALLILISFPIVAVTISRFDTTVSDPLESVYFYIGQQNLYFNNYALDDNGIRYGDRTIPLFKRMLFFDNVPKNFFERRTKYPKLHINDEVFVSYVGDIAIDFGPYVCLLIFVLYYFIFPRATRQQNGILTFDKLILLHFVVYLIANGGLKLYPFSDVGGNLKLMTYMILYLLYKKLTRLKDEFTINSREHQ